MTTLTTAPLAPLLDRLFEEADAALAETDAAVAGLSNAGQDRPRSARRRPTSRYIETDSEAQQKLVNA